MKKIFAAALLMPSMAFAHAGHDSGAPFISGLTHPIGGLDHVLAMVAVGLWAASVGGRAIWALPAAFVAAMVAGGALGAAHIGLPLVEPTILASSIIVGVAIAIAARLPLSMMLVMVAAFGLVHGHAHGAEGPLHGLAAYAVGFSVATAALHAAGLMLGRLPVARWLGAVTAAVGVVAAVA